MKHIRISLAAALGILAALPASAELLKCEALTEKITQRLESKQIKDYELKVVAAGDKQAGKEVGRCQGGSMKVMLLRGKAAEKSAAQ